MRFPWVHDPAKLSAIVFFHFSIYREALFSQSVQDSVVVVHNVIHHEVWPVISKRPVEAGKMDHAVKLSLAGLSG